MSNPHNITKVVSEGNMVEIVLENGVTLMVSSNKDHLHLNFSGTDTINPEKCSANGCNIKYSTWEK